MLIQQCCALLEQQKLKVAFIESASSGYLCSQFSIYKNSGADILLGGLVSYDPSIKIDVLNISAKLIQTHTAESIPVTNAMAEHGKSLFPKADMIIACTGLLKPGGSASLDKPEGTFYISIYYKAKITTFSYFLAGSPTTRLEQLTQHVAQKIIHLLEN